MAPGASEISHEQGLPLEDTGSKPVSIAIPASLWTTSWRVLSCPDHDAKSHQPWATTPTWMRVGAGLWRMNHALGKSKGSHQVFSGVSLHNISHRLGKHHPLCYSCAYGSQLSSHLSLALGPCYLPVICWTPSSPGYCVLRCPLEAPCHYSAFTESSRPRSQVGHCHWHVRTVSEP